MPTLTSYQGVAHNGAIRLRDVRLPEGAQVIVVVAEPQSPSAEELAQRLTTLPMDEWRKPFDNYSVMAEQHPADVDIDTISDAELDAIVHEVRAEMLGE
ncbi:MAG TPA: hypothetical protein VFF59_05845 [Anaerolineae bacterium]|nr:hypothetical protein [Anaerolineae bacterium]